MIFFITNCEKKKSCLFSMEIKVIILFCRMWHHDICSKKMGQEIKICVLRFAVRVRYVLHLQEKPQEEGYDKVMNA